MLRRALLLMPLAWAIWVIGVQIPYMSTRSIENKHSYDATHIRAAIRQIENPEAPVVDNVKECTDLFRFGAEHSIAENTQRQWHLLTAVGLLLVTLVAFAHKPPKRTNAT
jgi:hypothetical protein